jgi:hypothetical protein
MTTISTTPAAPAVLSTMSKRTTFKLGKLPARPNAVRFRMTTYVLKLPEPPNTFGHFGLIRDWEMLGNDSYGDCVLAGAAHETMLWTAMRATRRTITQAEDMFDDAQVLSDYSAVTGFDPRDLSTDRGTDMEEAAAYRRKVGILDRSGTRHKVSAYLSIRPGDFKRHKVGAYLFGAVGIGILFPGSAMDQFNRGEPWDVVSGSSIEGGHYIPVVGFTGEIIWVVTWGRLQAMTRRFLEKYNDESIAYVSREMLRKSGKSPEGVRIRQLEADLKGLGG